MFPKAKNIETAFQHIRLFTAIVVAGSLAFSCFIAWMSYRAISKTQSIIYVLHEGDAIKAFAKDRKDNIAVEARGHIKNFHELFFTLSPDEKSINENLSQALYLADGSAKTVYDNLKESGYYSGIIAGNITQTIIVDSIQVEIESYPFHFRCEATEIITRPTSVVTRKLSTEGWLRNSGRSDNNRHGFIIEHWSILDNRDLKTEAR